MMFGSSTSLHFLPGQQLKALQFCTKSNNIVENDSKRKLMHLKNILEHDTVQKRKKKMAKCV